MHCKIPEPSHIVNIPTDLRQPLLHCYPSRRGISQQVKAPLQKTFHIGLDVSLTLRPEFAQFIESQPETPQRDLKNGKHAHQS
jgi:hypothetical protein